MANKKYHYYILVLTSTGPVFVTGVPERHTAEWDKCKPPKEFSKDYAQDIVLGLSCNGYTAFMVTSVWEVDTQAYFYNNGHFEWVWNEDKKGE